MPVGNENLIRVARGLVSASPATREETSELICDWLHSYDRREVSVIAGLLSSVAVLESERDCLESELHALSELTGTGFIEADHLTPLWALQRQALRGSELEHFDYLASEYRAPD